MIHDVDTFIFLSRYAGMREDIVQAGGGNSSVKISPTQMLIKASGCQLADLTENTGYCTINPTVISSYFAQQNFEISEQIEKKLLADILPPPVHNNSYFLKPSIETFLHSVTQKYTLHTHPTVVNMLAANESGWSVLKNLFPTALFVGYATPGIKLAAQYFNAFKDSGKNLDIIFLKNHGLVVTAETAEEVIKKTENVLKPIEENLQINMSRYHNATAIYDVTRTIPQLKDKIVYLSQNADVLTGIEKFGQNLWDWQFCPDCLVYCGKKPLVLQEGFLAADFANHLSRYGAPVIVSYKGSVYILSGSVKKAKDTESVLAFSAQVALANQNGKLNLLSEREQNFLLNWDAEKYRQNLK